MAGFEDSEQLYMISDESSVAAGQQAAWSDTGSDASVGSLGSLGSSSTSSAAAQVDPATPTAANATATAPERELWRDARSAKKSKRKRSKPRRASGGGGGGRAHREPFREPLGPAGPVPTSDEVIGLHVTSAEKSSIHIINANDPRNTWGKPHDATERGFLLCNDKGIKYFTISADGHECSHELTLIRHCVWRAYDPSHRLLYYLQLDELGPADEYGISCYSFTNSTSAARPKGVFRSFPREHRERSCASEATFQCHRADPPRFVCTACGWRSPVCLRYARADYPRWSGSSVSSEETC